MGDSGITYATGRGVNPISGCLHDCQSERCWERCWARCMARRQKGRNGYPAGAESFKPTMHPDKLGVVQKRKKPQVIPMGFMGDMFCGAFSFKYLDLIFQDMEDADWHTYLILTKRVDIMAEYVMHWLATARLPNGELRYKPGEPLRKHIRIGCTVMDQKDANERIPVLLSIPAECLWVSHEPAIGPVDYTKIKYTGVIPIRPDVQLPFDVTINALNGTFDDGEDTGTCQRISQVAIGCESWQGNRQEFDPDWARLSRDQCTQYGVKFYLKQMYVDGKLVEKPFLDGRQWLETPA